MNNYKVRVVSESRDEEYLVETETQNAALHAVGAEHPEVYNETHTKVWVERATTQVFPNINNAADFAADGKSYSVYAEQYGEMVLAESGFASPGEAAEWAAQKFGLGNWEVSQN